MAYAPGEVTRFDQAKSLAAQLVKDARQGDVVSVVLMADPPRVVIREPSPNKAEVLKEIEEVTLPHGGTDLVASFDAVDRSLEASDISQKEVVFLTDLQAASWRRPERRRRRGAEARPGQAGGPAGAVGGHRPGQVGRHRTAPSPTCGSTRRSSSRAARRWSAPSCITTGPTRPTGSASA